MPSAGTHENKGPQGTVSPQWLTAFSHLWLLLETNCTNWLAVWPLEAPSTAACRSPKLTLLTQDSSTFLYTTVASDLQCWGAGSCWLCPTLGAVPYRVWVVTTRSLQPAGCLPFEGTPHQLSPHSAPVPAVTGAARSLGKPLSSRKLCAQLLQKASCWEQEAMPRN